MVCTDSSAKPPPMQNPMAPTRPVQSADEESHSRAASMSANALPLPDDIASSVDTMQRRAPPWLYRSGATVR
jgi:hypothetical protein